MKRIDRPFRKRMRWRWRILTFIRLAGECFRDVKWIEGNLPPTKAGMS